MAAEEAPRRDEDDEQEANPWRDEIVSKVFGDSVGSIKADFSCAIERQILLQGRMYVSDRFVCFYCSLFGFEKKIKIPYTHILAINKTNTARVIPNAITISTAKREYVFRSFWDRDDALRLLSKYHFAVRPPISVANAPRQTSVGSTGGLNTVTDSSIGGSAGAKMESSAAESPGLRGRAETVEDDDERRPSRDSEGGAEAGLVDGGTGGASQAAAAVNPAEAFATALEQRSFKHTGVVAIFPVGLAAFHEAFYATGAGPAATAAAVAEDSKSNTGGDGDAAASRDGAAPSLAAAAASAAAAVDPPTELGSPTVLSLDEFHALKGDTECAAEPWRAVADGGGVAGGPSPAIQSYMRTFRFRTPIVGSPIGPSSTRAVKTQVRPLYFFFFFSKQRWSVVLTPHAPCT